VKKILFLDRDGTINKESEQGGFVTGWKDFVFLPGAIEALKNFTNSGFTSIIFTNQSCVSRGIVTKLEIDNIHKELIKYLRSLGINVLDVFCCPHKSEDLCQCRKPLPGLLYQAAEKYYLDLSNSFLIGDALRDIQAGTSAGCKCFMVKTGHGKDDWIQTVELGLIAPDAVYDDLYAASCDASKWT